MSTRVIPLLARPMALPATLLVLGALAAPDARAQRILDTIVKNDGSSVRGVEVTSVTFEAVAYKRGEDELSVPGHLLERIQWHEPPEAFLKGKAFLDSGDFGNAVQQFSEASGEPGIREPIAIEAQFMTAKAAQLAAAEDPSKSGDALRALEGFVNERPDSVWIAEAMLLLGRAHRMAGNTESAVATLQTLESESLSKGWGALWNVRAKYETALTWLAAEDATKARAALSATVAAVDSSIGNAGDARNELQAMRLEATVAEGETYLADKNFTQAVSFYRALAQQPPAGRDTASVAAAKAGEGQALYLDAMAKNAPGKLRQAQLALAEAAVKDTAGGETSAKATYFQALCILAMGVEGGGDDFRPRAMAMLKTVATQYPSSRWATEARSAMNQ